MIIVGNKGLLDEKLAVILNSSQSKTPCENDPWIQQTSRAIPQLISQGYTIITSTGLSTWELQIYLVNVSAGNQIIISPVFDEANGENVYAKVIADFGLNPNKTTMIFIKPKERSRSPKENWLNRDKAALSLANMIAPVSIRPGGRLQEMLKDESVSLRCIDEFRIEFEKPRTGPKHYELKSQKEFKNWNYITHWTKTCHGSWPGELKGNYYMRLVSSGNSYPSHAFETLGNIIREGKIRASANKIREGRSAIGFTEKNPAQMLELIRWCPKRVNWNFEPYGVAIDKNVASELGIRPVIYGEGSDFQSLSDEDKPYFQSLGRDDTDWSQEKEWRHIGDLDLKQIPKENIIYLVWGQKETILLENERSERIMTIGDN